MTLLRSLVLGTLILGLALPAGGAAPSYAGFAAQAPTAGDDPGAPLRARFLADQEPVRAMEPMAFTPCVGGMAGSYPCSNVDLGAFLPNSSIGGGNASSIWGWTDPLTGREYALMGRTNGTAFVDITDPASPVYLGNLPSATGSSSWRELKAFGTYAYIISDSNGQHGMQVFDLAQLRNVVSPPATFTAPRYTLFGSAHDITINPDTGYLYVTGISTGGANACSGSLHMIDVRDPGNPLFAGCAGSAYTHDTTCVVYHGPDAQHRGKEICINSNGNQSNGGQVVILDVTNKVAPAPISARSYAGAGYVHQGWLTEDHRYFYLDDELDEMNFGHATRTYVWDMVDLDNPVLAHTYTGPTAAIDHNQFIVGNRSYQANYRAGLRILDISNPLAPFESGYFDVYPANNNANFNGAWGNYPFFDSGAVIVSGIEQGLFVLLPRPLCTWRDLDCSCQVDALDISQAAQSWSCGLGDACYRTRADRDRDGLVTVADIMQFSSQWGWNCPAP
jgi:choice-of-anchor B domain-containing protein